MTRRIYTKSQLNLILFSLLGRHELVDNWWNSKNHGFDGKTPNEIYFEGEEGKHKVADYILLHYNGGY